MEQQDKPQGKTKTVDAIALQATRHEELPSWWLVTFWRKASNGEQSCRSYYPTLSSLTRARRAQHLLFREAV